MTDERLAGYIARGRLAKALELEGIAVDAKVRAADLTDTEVRRTLLAVLAQRRGKPRMTASTDTWRLVWRMLHDREHGRGDAGRQVG